LVPPKDDDYLSSELESRLNDLFREDEVTGGDPQETDHLQEYPLADLKSLVLSIDWEITDKVLEKFLQQLSDLKLTYEHDKIILTFLQILSSLGEYIKMNRGKAHPKTFKILNSVFSQLDKVVLSKDMSETDRKKILRTELHRYKELRTQISRRKAAVAHKKIVRPVEIQKPRLKKEEVDSGVSAAKPVLHPFNVAKEELSAAEQHRAVYVEALADAVEEIKQYIHVEIKAIKEELKLLRTEK
jgi:hypothetical protein